MDSSKLLNFIVGFESTVLPIVKFPNDGSFREANQGIVYYISKSMSEDKLIRDVTGLGNTSQAEGRFMGIVVKICPDTSVVDFRK